MAKDEFIDLTTPEARLQGYTQGREVMDRALTATERSERQRMGVDAIKRFDRIIGAGRHFKDTSLESDSAKMKALIGQKVFGIEGVAVAPRNLARFTTDDAAEVLGRPLTAQEERNLVKTLENSSMGEVFAECVNLIADADKEGED